MDRRNLAVIAMARTLNALTTCGPLAVEPDQPNNGHRQQEASEGEGDGNSGRKHHEADAAG